MYRSRRATNPKPRRSQKNLRRKPVRPIVSRVTKTTGTIPSVDHGDQPARDLRSQAERLLELSSVLSSAVTLADVSDAVMAATSTLFPESAGTIIVRRSSRETDLEVFAVSDLPGQVFENWRSFPIDADAPLAECVRTGDIIRLKSPGDWETRYPHLVPLLAETGHRAQLVTPLVAGGATIGALGIAFRSERTFPDDETQLLVAVTAQCAIALERARLYDLEKEARQAAEMANRAKSNFLASLSPLARCADAAPSAPRTNPSAR